VLGDAELVRAAQQGDAASLGSCSSAIARRSTPWPSVSLAADPRCRTPPSSPSTPSIGCASPRRWGAWLRSVVRNLCYTRLRKAPEQVALDEPPAHLR
jgi:hypothetical protein